MRCCALSENQQGKCSSNNNPVLLGTSEKTDMHGNPVQSAHTHKKNPEFWGGIQKVLKKTRFGTVISLQTRELLPREVKQRLLSATSLPCVSLVQRGFNATLKILIGIYLQLFMFLLQSYFVRVFLKKLKHYPLHQLLLTFFSAFCFH